MIEMPPRAFCLGVTFTLSAGSSSASATSALILAASASQKMRLVAETNQVQLE